jgi:hypothetical protein
VFTVFKIIHFIIFQLEFNLLLLLYLIIPLSQHVISCFVVVVGGGGGGCFGLVSRTDVNFFPFGQTVPRLCRYVMFAKSII